MMYSPNCHHLRCHVYIGRRARMPNLYKGYTKYPLSPFFSCGETLLHLLLNYSCIVMQSISMNESDIESISPSDGLNEASSGNESADENSIISSATRTVYLLTYSQANLNTFPLRKDFAKAVVDFFTQGSGKVLQWCCSLENHSKRKRKPILVKTSSSWKTPRSSVQVSDLSFSSRMAWWTIGRRWDGRLFPSITKFHQIVNSISHPAQSALLDYFLCKYLCHLLKNSLELNRHFHILYRHVT